MGAFKAASGARVALFYAGQIPKQIFFLACFVFGSVTKKSKNRFLNFWPTGNFRTRAPLSIFVGNIVLLQTTKWRPDIPFSSGAKLDFKIFELQKFSKTVEKTAKKNFATIFGRPRMKLWWHQPAAFKGLILVYITHQRPFRLDVFQLAKLRLKNRPKKCRNSPFQQKSQPVRTLPRFLSNLDWSYDQLLRPHFGLPNPPKIFPIRGFSVGQIATRKLTKNCRNSPIGGKTSPKTKQKTLGQFLSDLEWSYAGTNQRLLKVSFWSTYPQKIFPIRCFSVGQIATQKPTTPHFGWFSKILPRIRRFWPKRGAYKHRSHPSY